MFRLLRLFRMVGREVESGPTPTTPFGVKASSPK
jgi:hypothetical protein